MPCFDLLLLPKTLKGSLLGRIPQSGQAEPDFSLTGLGIDPHASSMCLDQFLDNGQADPSTAMFPRPRFFTAVKPFEYIGKIG